MWDSKSVRCGDKLSAIPETRCRCNGGKNIHKYNYENYCCYRFMCS